MTTTQHGDGFGRTPVPSTTEPRKTPKLSRRPSGEGSAAKPLPSKPVPPGEPGRPIFIGIERAPSRGPAGAEGEFWLKVTYTQGTFWYRGESAIAGLLYDLQHGRVRLHKTTTTRRKRHG